MKKDNQLYNKGMNKDANPLFKPEGTYQFALNSLLGTKEGDDNTIANEEGNIACGDLPSGSYSVIGHVQLDDNRTVLFITDNLLSIVGIYNPDKCGFDNLIVSTCMNLRTDKQVDAIFRIVRGCERTVYFTDGYNPYKNINIDRLEDYLADGFTSVAEANEDPANGWNCIKMNHFPYYLAPCVEFDSIIEGSGNLQVGVYQFAIRYLDMNLNPTNWIYITNCIPIVDDSLSSTYEAIDGHEPSNTRYNRSISLNINELDSNFKYIQLAAIESVNGLGTVTNAYILDKVSINSATTVNYVYGGFNPNIHQLSIIGDIITPNIIINTVEAHEQTDNRLLLGNVSTYTEDWATLQRLATLVNVKWVSKEIDVQNHKQDSKYPLYYYDTMSYMRDEIYALGIVYVFENGTESPVFHIPGRIKDVDELGNDLTTTYGNTILNNHFRGSATIFTTPWDSQLLQVVQDGRLTDPETQIEISNVQHIPQSEFVGPCTTYPDVVGSTPTIIFDIIVNAGSIDLSVNSGLSVGAELNARVIIQDSVSQQAFYDQIIHFTPSNTVNIALGYPLPGTDSFVIWVDATVADADNVNSYWLLNTKSVISYLIPIGLIFILCDEVPL